MSKFTRKRVISTANFKNRRFKRYIKGKHRCIHKQKYRYVLPTTSFHCKLLVYRNKKNGKTNNFVDSLRAVQINTE